MPRLSVLVPVYFNEHNLPTTIPTLIEVANRLPGGMSCELIFVDDGSGDRSWNLLQEAAARETRITAIRLSRNFGAYMALQAGLEAATGDCIAVIMADLQDPPELILKMVDAWRNGKKIVIAERAEREDRLVGRVLANIFWGFMRRFAIPTLPKGGFDFVLFDRVVADVLRASREKNSHFMLQVFQTGFPAEVIPYVRKERAAGKSRWTFGKRFKLFLDSAIAFSYVPVRAMGCLGVLTAVVGFIAAAAWIILRIFFGVPVEGWTSIMVAVLILGGIQMIMLGLIGEYLWRTYDETRQRPPYIVAERINAKTEQI